MCMSIACRCLTQSLAPSAHAFPLSAMSNTFKNISVEEALESNMAVDGFRCIKLKEEHFPGLQDLQLEVWQVIFAGRGIKNIKLEMEDQIKKRSDIYEDVKKAQNGYLKFYESVVM